jgi:ceramide glucosyltransferase
LKKEKVGVTSGYRWFVPEKNNIPTLALSAVNAKVAQFLGNSILNQAWGGSMAIRVDTFRQLGLDTLWQTTLSDDLSLGSAVHKAKLKIAYIPACLVASYEKTSWSKLFEFGRRQFLITRVYTPGTWFMALLTALFAFLGLWATAAVAIYAKSINDPNTALFTAVPIAVFSCQFLRAVVRQFMAAKLLKKDLNKMKFAMLADILFFWIWAILLLVFILSSAIGRCITWRNIRYKLISPSKTIILNQ